ncbi:MAG: hypothetical protein K2N76_05950, partial [Muribaculaceae bacterium]|nr:hypothetical protein [Muribaculaceae bacterium]
MKKRLLFTSAIALAGFASVATAADYDCSSLGNTNRNDRTVTALNLVDDQGSSLTINPVQPNSNPQPIYIDKSSEYTFTTVPGATVTVTPTSKAEWMHSYMYIDWAGDGFAFSQYSDYMDTVSDTEFALRPGVDLVAFTRWRPTGDYHYHDHNGPNASYGGGQLLNEPFSFTLPADAKPGTYRIRYKSAYNQLDPNGVADIFSDNTIQKNGGCICDFTLVIEGEEEPDPVVDYDLSSLGKVNWEIGNNRFLTDITLQSSASKLVLSPIRGDGQSDLEKRNQVYHDHSDLVFAIEAGDVFHLLVNGGTINANYKNMPTYVYIDWGKDGFIYST